MVRSVSLFGSTGSIGCQTLEIISLYPEKFTVDTLVAGRNAPLLIDQARRHRPRYAVIADPQAFGLVKEALAGTGIQVMAGETAILERAKDQATDLKMMAIMGIAGLAPTLAAVEAGGMVGLSNKESLVCAGTIVMKAAEQAGTTLLPIDSEHNSLFQVLQGHNIQDLEKLTITASGGPYWTKSLEEMKKATITTTLNHNYAMGREITVNSATMMNKGFELVETVHLFQCPQEKIEVLVHPEQIIHGMAAYNDGSTLAALASHDMKVPLSYVLGWPYRLDGQARRFDLSKVGRLSFFETDDHRFPALRLIRACLDADDGSMNVLNAANEFAVRSFLEGHLAFLDMMALVEETLTTFTFKKVTSADEALAIDAEVKQVLQGHVGTVNPLRKRK